MEILGVSPVLSLRSQYMELGLQATPSQSSLPPGGEVSILPIKTSFVANGAMYIFVL